MSITDKARTLITKAKQNHDMTIVDIANLCGVNEGSVQRWFTTGKARLSAIQPLVDLVENSRISAGQTAEELVNLYWHVRRPIKITYNQFRKLSGRKKIAQSFAKDVENELIELGYLFLSDEDEEGRIVYAVVRKQWLFGKKGRAVALDKSMLEEYYSEQLEEDEEEDF